MCFWIADDQSPQIDYGLLIFQLIAVILFLLLFSRQKRHTDLKTTSIVWDLDCLYIFCWWLADLVHHNLCPATMQFYVPCNFSPPSWSQDTAEGAADGGALQMVYESRRSTASGSWWAHWGLDLRWKDASRPGHLSSTTCQPVLSYPSFHTISSSHPPE